MVRCTCGKWTPGILGFCADCYEGGIPEVDAATRQALQWVREQERQIELHVEAGEIPGEI